MNDKNWQKGVERDLVEFCLNNGYPNAALKEKDFHPINTNLFRYVIVLNWIFIFGTKTVHDYCGFSNIAVFRNDVFWEFDNSLKSVFFVKRGPFLLAQNFTVLEYTAY